MGRAGLSTERVVDAAAELVDADGLPALTLARLAERLGVRTPSLYAHVAGLPGLRARLAARGGRMLHATLAEAAAGRAGGDALRATLTAYRAFAHAHPGLYAATQAPWPADDPEVVDAARRVVEVMFAVMRGYGLQDDDGVHAVRVVRSAVHGFVALETGGGFGMPVAVQETWERLIAMLDAGLASPAPLPGRAPETPAPLPDRAP